MKLQLTTRQKIIMSALVIILVLAYLVYFMQATRDIIEVPIATVKLATVSQKSATDIFDTIGTVKAVQGTNISSVAAGIVTSINFAAGQSVKQGQLLFTLKNDDLQAILKQDQAKYFYNLAQFQRYSTLVKKDIISPAMSDQIKTSVEQAKAQVEHDQALLNDTIITAPFAGILGISPICLGQYVAAGQTLVSLQNLSNLYVDFYVPERLLDVLQLGRPVTINSNQSKYYSWHGNIFAMGAALNIDTRSLLVRAKINPPYTNLVPGMFVTVSAAISNSKPVLTVPQQAIVYSPYGYSVYLFRKGMVTQRIVELGEQVEDAIIIKNGLSRNDRIVIAGQQKLFNGAYVKVEQ